MDVSPKPQSDSSACESPAEQQILPAPDTPAVQDGPTATGAPAVSTSTPADSVLPERTSARLLSLDVFRGLTILLMLLVNNTALDTATPAQLTHARWGEGLRLADLVYPWFLFCVGVAVPFSAASFRRKGLPCWKYDAKVIRRAVVLVLLGCLVDSCQVRRPVFTLGVLQLIGLAYLVAAMLYDLPAYRRLLLAVLLLAAYWAAIKYLPIPGVGPGALDESRNFIWHLNRSYLNAVHLWGLPSLVPTSALVLIGTVIGDWLRRHDIDAAARTAILLLAGMAQVSVALLWSVSLGLNRALWTPSSVLMASGAATLLLGVLYLVVDVNAWRRWSFPLEVLGANAILAYVGPILVKLLILQQWQVTAAQGKTESVLLWFLDRCVGLAGRVPGGWLYTAAYIAVWWVVLWDLHRRRIFLRV